MLKVHEDDRVFTINAALADQFYNGNAYSSVLFLIPKLIQKLANVMALYFSVETATIPSSWYNIEEGTNNVLQVILTTLPGTSNTFTLSIPEGTYLAAELVDSLNDSLVAATITAFTFTYSQTRNKIGITWNTTTFPATLQLSFGVATTMAENLGIVFESDVILNNTETWYFTKQCDLRGVKTYLVVMDQIVTSNWSRALNANVTLPVQNEALRWGNTFWMNTTNLRFSIPINSTVDSLNVRIYSDRGKLIDFRGVPWMFTLKVSYEINRVPLPTEIVSFLDAVKPFETDEEKEKEKTSEKKEAKELEENELPIEEEMQLEDNGAFF